MATIQIKAGEKTEDVLSSVLNALDDKTLDDIEVDRKMAATEGAQRVIDRAVQIFGGLGVGVGSVVEHLYREIRPLRIYEGATEVQKLIIGRDLLKARN